jgi:hypothetical protein
MTFSDFENLGVSGATWTELLSASGLPPWERPQALAEGQGKGAGKPTPYQVRGMD